MRNGFQESLWWSTILNVGNKTRIHHWQYSAAFSKFFLRKQVSCVRKSHAWKPLFKNGQKFLYFLYISLLVCSFCHFFCVPFFGLIWLFSEKSASLLSCPVEYTMKKPFTKIFWAHISELQLKIFVPVAFRVISVYRHKKAQRARFFLFPLCQTYCFINVRSYQRRI